MSDKLPQPTPSYPDDGWISLHRRVRNHFLFREDRKFSRFEAWVDLLLSANHADRSIIVGAESISVQRGSVYSSVAQLATRWEWSRGKVDRFLKCLLAERMINVQQTNGKGTLIYIVNYDTYQHQRTKNRRKTNTRRTSGEHLTDTNNNYNNTQVVIPSNYERSRVEGGCRGEKQDPSVPQIVKGTNHVWFKPDKAAQIIRIQGRDCFDYYIDGLEQWYEDNPKKRNQKCQSLRMGNWIRRDMAEGRGFFHPNNQFKPQVQNGHTTVKTANGFVRVK